MPKNSKIPSPNPNISKLVFPVVFLVELLRTNIKSVVIIIENMGITIAKIFDIILLPS